MKKQSLLKGSLILATAGIITRFLGLFFRWPLIMLIGDEGVGYYQMSYPLYMFFVAMASGVPIAVSKMISENNAMGKYKENFQVIKETFVLMLFLGAGMTCILFFFSKPIISFLNWDHKAYYSLIGVSFAPVIISFVMVLRGFFQGYQNMTYPAISQIIEQIGRVIFGVGLAFVLLPRGIEYSAGGAAFGAAAGGILSLIYLYFSYKKSKKKYNIKKVSYNTDLLSKILRISIPVSLGATACTVMTLIDSVLVPSGLVSAGFETKEATILYAQLSGKASVIVNVPLTLSVAICTSLLPQIAEAFILNNKKILHNKINLSIRMSQVIAIPCMFGLFFLSAAVLNCIFPGRADGANILKYLAISIPFIAITQVTTAILQGVNSFVIPVINLLVGSIIKMILTILLVKIPSINIYGAIIATIAAYVLISVLNILAMKKKTKIKIGLYQNIFKPILASMGMILSVLSIYRYLFINTSSNFISLIISIIIGVIIYILLIVILRIFTISEIKEKISRDK